MAEPRGTGAWLDASPYSSRLEARWLADDPEVRHRRLSGSLVSADLSGFTAMSEHLAKRGKEGAERLTDVVNGCFTALINAAASEGGDVLKFGGDALLIWFEGDGHAVRAARAGARMQRAIGAVRFGRAGLRMSVGGHTGEFDAFLVGQADWRELVLAGAPVTTTVDLEAAAGAGEVLVSPDLAAQLPGAWRGERHGDGVSLALVTVPRPRGLQRLEQSAPTPVLSSRVRDDVDALGGLGGEHRMATIVFAELEGTDARIEAAADGMVDSIEQLVLATQEQASRFGLRFLYTDVIADGIKLICTAGAPTSTGQDEEAGLRFATELACGDPHHRLHVGVNRGRVFAGFLGSESRRAYTVMGDPVNLAARLMARAEPGQVVASDDVVRRSEATFRLDPLPPFLVKGKVAPITAHVVEEATGERRGQQQSSLPLVGRAHEVELLTAAIGAAAEGRGAVVEITGDAGIGKTRLIDRFADDPRLVVRVRTECQPYDALSPYASARTLLRRALGIPSRASAAQAGQQLRATAARLAPDVVPLLPLVAVPLGADVPATPEADAVAEQFRTERMHGAVGALLSAALPQTTLLVVEDVYYADDASLRLFRALAADAPRRPWLLVVTRRPEGDGLVGGTVEGTVVELAPLSTEEVARLAVLATGGKGFHPLEQEAVAQRAGGNPLFLLQLVSATQAGTSADELPESIERVVATRIDRLPPAERALLRQAAVVGRVFHRGVLDALRTGNGAEPVTQQQWDLLGDLVEPEGESRGRFRHALFRDVAYEGLPFARRRRMHTAVGGLLEDGVAGEPDVALLSEHFWLAGDAERTWRYSVAAGEQAWAAYAVTEAIAAYERALGVRRRLPLVDPEQLAHVAETLGDVLERASRYDDAIRAYGRSRQVSAPTRHGATEARLMRKVGVVREHQGHFAQSARWLLRARGTLNDRRADHGDELAEIELSLSATRHRQGHHVEMVTWAAAALEHAGTSRDVAARAHDLMQVAVSHGAGQPGTAHGELALKLFRNSGNVHRQGFSLINLGVEAHLRGRWAEAVARYSDAEDALKRAGDVAVATIAANNRAEILTDQGNLAAADRLLALVDQRWRQSGYGIGVAVVTLNRGRVRARQSRWHEAETFFDEASRLFRELGSASYEIETAVRRGEAWVMQGQPELARLVVESALQDSEENEVFPHSMSAANRVVGWASLQLGRPDEARVAFNKALDLSRASGSLYEVGLALDGLVATDPLESHAAGIESLSIRDQLAVVSVPQVPLPG